MAFILRAPRYGILPSSLLCPDFLCGQVHMAFIVSDQGKARTVLESLLVANRVRISSAGCSHEL